MRAIPFFKIYFVLLSSKMKIVIPFPALYWVFSWDYND